MVKNRNKDVQGSFGFRFPNSSGLVLEILTGPFPRAGSRVSAAQEQGPSSLTHPCLYSVKVLTGLFRAWWKFSASPVILKNLTLGNVRPRRHAGGNPVTSSKLNIDEVPVLSLASCARPGSWTTGQSCLQDSPRPCL